MQEKTAWRNCRKHSKINSTQTRQQSKDKNEAQRDVDRQKNEALLSDAYQQLAKATNALCSFQQQSGIDKLENERQGTLRQLNDLRGRRDRVKRQD